MPKIFYQFPSFLLEGIEQNKLPASDSRHLLSTSLLSRLLRLLLILLLQRRQFKHLAQAALNNTPPEEARLLRPGKHADPRLHVVMHLQHYVVELGELARRSRDLVFWFLVAELDLPPIL
jgi:hypothetical protein